ncbi:MAG: VWA domain-containing protein [Rhodocyclaceae bacterium]|nr:VWA domain-containing protein [Rhodocyclaceae bacterium]
MNSTRRAFCLGLPAAGALLGRQQAAQPPIDPTQTITLEVTRVNLLFTVSDKKGRFVTDLKSTDFDILEGRKQQKILDFLAESDMPLRIALLIDTSNSIKTRFKFQLEAASEFLADVIRPEKDKALIYSYDTQAELVQPLTSDAYLLQKKLMNLRPGGGTAMHDALAEACRDHLGKEQPRHQFRRAVIIIGDGEDNSSRRSRDQALEMAHKADTVIYAISTNITKVETDGDRLLKYLAEETGGLAYFPFKAEDLTQDFENLANELRSQYSIMYRPEPMHTDGLYHEVKIRLKDRKGLEVRSRKGYYAPKS